jgi:hypothetical protein
MPRKPSGRALSGAERQRHYRERHRPVPKLDARHDVDAVLAAAKAGGAWALAQLRQRTVAEIRDRAQLLRLVAIYRPQDDGEVLDRLWSTAWEL